MATPTVANSQRHPELFAEGGRSLAEPICPGAHQFHVYPTGEAEYHWRIAAFASNVTISRHKSLKFALKKCTWLNVLRGQGVRNDSK